MAKVKLLNRDAILKADDLPYEDVHVEEWDGWVRVRTLTGTERDAFEASVVEQRGKSFKVNRHNFRAKLVSLTVVDDEGNRIFTDADVKLLGQKSASAIDKIFGVAQKLSGLDDDDVDELIKNSEDDLSEDSTLG